MLTQLTGEIVREHHKILDSGELFDGVVHESLLYQCVDYEPNFFIRLWTVT
jgi:hypothetical protein